MTYTELVQAIQDYTENTESTFIASIPIFVRNAEKRIYHDCPDLPRAQRTEDVLAVVDQVNYTLPDGFLAPVAMSVRTPEGAFISYPDNKEPEYARIAFSNSDSRVPRVYAVIDHDSFLVLPAPDDAYILRMTYFAVPPSIVDAETTWLGDNFDFVLLYGALVEAYTFMKGEADMLQAYTLQYKDSLALLKNFSREPSHRDSLRYAKGR